MWESNSQIPSLLKAIGQQPPTFAAWRPGWVRWMGSQSAWVASWCMSWAVCMAQFQIPTAQEWASAQGLGSPAIGCPLQYHNMPVCQFYLCTYYSYLYITFRITYLLSNIINIISIDNIFKNKTTSGILQLGKQIDVWNKRWSKIVDYVSLIYLSDTVYGDHKTQNS